MISNFGTLTSGATPRGRNTTKNNINTKIEIRQVTMRQETMDRQLQPSPLSMCTCVRVYVCTCVRVYDKRSVS